MRISGSSYPQIVNYLHPIQLRKLDHTLIRPDVPPLFRGTV